MAEKGMSLRKQALEPYRANTDSIELNNV